MHDSYSPPPPISVYSFHPRFTFISLHLSFTFSYDAMFNIWCIIWLYGLDIVAWPHMNFQPYGLKRFFNSGSLWLLRTLNTWLRVQKTQVPPCYNIHERKRALTRANSSCVSRPKLTVKNAFGPTNPENVSIRPWWIQTACFADFDAALMSFQSAASPLNWWIQLTAGNFSAWFSVSATVTLNATLRWVCRAEAAWDQLLHESCLTPLPT